MPGRPALVCSTLVLLAACSGGGRAAPSTSTAASTTTATTLGSTTTTGASTTTTTSPAPTTAAAAACQGTEVENPAIIAVSAADGSPCWSALPDSNATPVAVADGRLFVSGNSCPPAAATPVLVAIDTATGSELWRHPTPASQEGANDSRVVVGTGSGVIVPRLIGPLEAVDVTTGGALWTRAGVSLVGDGPDSVAVISETPSPTLSLLDRRSGQERWSVPVSGASGSVGGLAVDDNVVLASGESSTAVYDAKTGQHLRDLPITAASDTPVARLVDGVASGVTGSGRDANSTQAYDAVSGQSIWTNPGFPPQRPEPTDGNIYVTVDGGVQALDPRSGTERWTVEGADLEAGPGLALTTASSDQPDAKLDAIDPATGQVRWTKTQAELGLPDPAEPLPSGATVSYVGVLPSASGVFFAYGDCLGS